MVLGWWAHPSILHSVGGPIRLHCTWLMGPLYSVGGPIRLHCTRLMGPSVYMVLGWWAHPSTLHSVGGPIHLYCTQLVGPVISIIHTPLAHPSLMYTILHWPIPFHWVHTTHSAHPSIMVQLPPWAEVGWPVSIGTLSPLAARLRRVNSLKGLWPLRLKGQRLCSHWIFLFVRAYMK